MACKATLASLLVIASLALAAADCRTANLGSWCDDKNTCCAGAPKNAKCVNFVCVTTYPSGGPAPAPAPTPSGSCKTFANLGAWCDNTNTCCNGAPKNAKCSNYVCVTTYPTPAPAPTPAPVPTPAPTPSGTACKSFANIGEKCNTGAGICCGGGPKNTKCANAVCVSNYPGRHRI